ncbi:MAG: protein kinase [Pyrinomonadaceae bacterium]
MDSERLNQIEEIYHAALDVAPSDRDSFLNECCGGDDDLRREVESLLPFANTPDNFIDESPGSLAGEMFSELKGDSNLSNKTIGHFTVIRLIGAGGMGEVYLAEDTKLDRKVALKILSPEFAGDTNRMSRFVREAKSASALNHPNILTIHEINEHGGTHFIATEFIDGQTLNEYRKNNTLGLRSMLEIAIQVVSALDEAHSAGIVHRDIKPENVMIRKDGIVKVLDFGLAKPSGPFASTGALSEDSTRVQFQTQPGLIIGTPNYMSPEQARGKNLDHRTDIFSFGVVLYEMFSGSSPFDGETVSDVIAAVLTKDPKPLIALPAGLDEIVHKTLQKRRRNRYQTAKHLLSDLKEVKDELEIQSRLGRDSTPDAGLPKTQIFQANNIADETDGTFRQADEFIETQNNLSGELSPTIGGKHELAKIAELIKQPETRLLTLTGVGGSSTGDVLNNQTAIFSTGETAISAGSHPDRFTTNIKSKSVSLIALVIALAIGGFFGYRYFTANRQINSIAVLPFVNVGDDLSSEYLSDGLSENLINTLSRLPQLKVIARSSSFRYRGENIDIQDAGRKLGVGAILTGRVVRRGDDLQISIELINTADNTHIWGEIYNRRLSGALSLPEEIAQAVSQKLQLELTGAQERQMAKQMTQSPQAYQAYLNGIFFRRKNGTENIRKAIEYQNRAIALDQNFTLAYIELSINLGNLVDIGALSPKEGLPQARAAAEKALAFDETLADAHYNIARIRKYEFDWTRAEQGFKRAIEINPNLAAAHTIYAEYLSQLGRFEEALREIKLAQELDPLRTGLVGNEGSIFYYARRYDEAIVKKQIHANSAPENPFAHLGLADAYVQKGQYAEAILSYQTSIRLEETTGAMIYLGRAYALSGKRDEATGILDKLEATKKYVSPAEMAIIYAALGDQEKAFASLEKAYTERDFQLTSLKVEPGFDPLRDDPRFADLLRRLGFPQ